MTEEIKKEEPKMEPDNGKIKPEAKPEISSAPVTDFKVAEIWIRNGQLMLDATHEFWRDKFRARGVIAYLDDIVKDAKVPYSSYSLCSALEVCEVVPCDQEGAASGKD